MRLVMTDIVERLRHWSHGLTYDPAAGLIHEAAAEIERLRTSATQATAGRGSVQDGCTLTDEEREAVEWYAGYGRDGLHADTLRNLLKRLHT
jgi:hypothetical protein